MNKTILAVVFGLGLACQDVSPPPSPEPAKAEQADLGDDQRRAFAKSVEEHLLDTELYELRANLFVKVKNPNPDSESAVIDKDVKHEAAPGPHLYDGEVHADIEVLRSLLDPQKRTAVSIEETRVFAGEPEALILGHQHDKTLYVPVKLFARQFGAYVDITSTLANTAIIWPRETLEYARAAGLTQSTGLLEGHAEGIVKNVDVRAKPRW